MDNLNMNEPLKKISLEEFNEGVKTITKSGMHDYNEAINRTPKGGFILTKMYRSLDFYHWSAEYTRIEEWKSKGGVISAVEAVPPKETKRPIAQPPK